MSKWANRKKWNFDRWRLWHYQAVFVENLVLLNNINSLTTQQISKQLENISVAKLTSAVYLYTMNDFIVRITGISWTIDSMKKVRLGNFHGI